MKVLFFGASHKNLHEERNPSLAYREINDLDALS